jgi:Protein of unknown function (DUF1552)
MLKELKVSRRFALRGALSGIGIAMWLPVLDAMCNNHGDAFAQGDALPTTFGIWFWGNGVHPQYWTPQATGSGDAWQLARNMEPLADVKEHITLVTGLDMLDGKFKGHGWGNVYMLAGGDGQSATVTSDIDRHQNVAYETTAATQYLPTIDQLVADQIGEGTPFKSIETGVMEYRGIDMGTTSKNLAHRGRQDFLPPERNPKTLFDRLFSNGVPDDPAGPSLVFSKEMRRSTLDAVLEDAKRLQQVVGADDKQRLSRHMDSIRAVEQRIDSIENATGNEGACTIPEAPANPANATERGQALHRLVATALACNLTRVYTHLFSGGRDDNTYPMININSDHHGLTHGNAADNENAALIEKYIMEQYADMIAVLRDTPIGTKTALDQTLLYGVTDVSEPNGHVMANYHIVLSGHAGGRMPGNRHIRLPKRKVTELQLTMLQTMGLEIDSFGSWDNTRTTIPEIFG